MQENWNAVLAWIKGTDMFLKIQSGTGDNLSEEDIEAGMVDYVLWSIFEPGEIGIDEELEMKVVDGGMVTSKEEITEEMAIAECYEWATGVKLKEGALVVIKRT